MQVNEVPFTDLLSAIVDNRGRTCPTADHGWPLIATNCIVNDGLFPVSEKVRYVSQEVYDTWFRGHPEPGDIIVVCKGSPGNVAMVPDPIDFCIAQDMVAVRADPTAVYPKYLFASFDLRRFGLEYASMNVGTLIPHFKKGDFGKLLIPVPDRPSQKFIGDLYFNLSAKIESCRRITATVDALIRTEVRAIVRASDEVVVRRLDDVAERVSDTVDPAALVESVPYIGLEHMPRGSMVLDKWGESEGLVSGKARFQRGDVLFGKLRPNLKKVGIAPIDGVCSTDILVLRPRTEYPTVFLAAVVAANEALDYASAAASGTRMPRISWNYLAAYAVSVPSRLALAKTAAELGPILEIAVTSVHEAHALAQIRDALLPELLAGRLRTLGAERVAEVAM